jgi:predicted MFS family arabinose efflux permease
MQAAQRGRWAVASMFAANGFVMGAWAPQIPLLQPRHDISNTTLGLLILGLGIGAVAAMLFAGRLIQTYGSRRVAYGFGLATVPCLPLVVFAPNLWLLAPAMALMGAIVGCMDVAMNANAVEVERRLGRAVMSSSHGFWSLGGFIGGFIGSFIIAHFGAETQALTAAALTLAAVLWAGPRLIEDAPQAETIAKTKGAITLPREAALWVLGFMALASMIPEGAVLDWAAIYLKNELGSDQFTAGLGFACFAGTMAVMRFAGDSLRNRFGAVKTLQISGLISATGLLAAALAPNEYVAIAAIAFAGLGIANLVPILFSAAGNYPGLGAGIAISTVTMVGYAGILIAPSSIGFAADHVGFRVTYATLAILLLVVTALAPRAAMADGVTRR